MPKPNPHIEPGPDPQVGDPIEDKTRTLGAIIGQAYWAKDATIPGDTDLSNKVKNATWEDVLQAHGWVPPGGSLQSPPKLSPADLANLKDALQRKTGWKYEGVMPTSCCSCVP
jgi:hypothetical protein